MGPFAFGLGEPTRNGPGQTVSDQLGQKPGLQIAPNIADTLCFGDESLQGIGARQAAPSRIRSDSEIAEPHPRPRFCHQLGLTADSASPFGGPLPDYPPQTPGPGSASPKNQAGVEFELGPFAEQGVFGAEIIEESGIADRAGLGDFANPHRVEPSFTK